MECRISAPEKFSGADSINITFEFINTSDRDVYFLRQYTPWEDPITDFLIVTSDKKEVRYDSRYIFRGAPAENDFALIKHNASLKTTIDLSRLYKIEAEKNYEIALRFQTIKTTDSLREIVFNDSTLVSNSISFFVGSLTKEHLTNGEVTRSVAPEQKPTLFVPSASHDMRLANFIGDPRFRSVFHAHRESIRILYKCLGVLQDSSSNNRHFRKWFGNVGAGQFDLVRNNFTNMLRQFEAGFNYVFGDGCIPGGYGHTNPGTTTISICDGFFGAPLVGLVSQPTVLIHEASHAVAWTFDGYNGYKEALDLAARDPYWAARSAFNYSWFAGDIALPVPALRRDAWGKLQLYFPRVTRGTGQYAGMMSVALWNKRQRSKNAWENSAFISSAFTFPEVGYVAAMQNQNGLMELLFLDRSKLLTRRRQDASNNYSMGADIDTEVLKVCFEKNSDGRLEAFTIGSDFNLWHQWQASPDGNWVAAAMLDQDAQYVAAARNRSGSLEVFYVKADGSVFHQWQTGGGWSGPSPLENSASEISATTNADGRVIIFMIRNNKELWTKSQITPGGGWNASVKVSDNVLQFAFAANSSGTIELYMVKTDFNLWKMWQVGPSSDRWIGNSKLDEWVLQVAAERNADGRLEIVMFAGDLNLWSKSQDSPGSTRWTGAGIIESDIVSAN